MRGKQANKAKINKQITFTHKIKNENLIKTSLARIQYDPESKGNK